MSGKKNTRKNRNKGPQYEQPLTLIDLSETGGEEYTEEEYTEEEYAGEEYTEEEYAGDVAEEVTEEYWEEDEEAPAEEYAEAYEEEYADEYPDNLDEAAYPYEGTGTGRKHSFIAIVAAAVAGLAVIVGIVYLVLAGYSVKSEITVEAGNACPEVKAFLNWSNQSARFVSNPYEETVFSKIGDYGVLIHAYGKDTASVVHVKDTIAPAVTTKDVLAYMGNAVQPEDFIEEIIDMTATQVRFKETPDFTMSGTHTIILEVEDEGGNVTEAEAVLDIYEDTEPPVISGVDELTMTVGGSISYKKGVTVSDNLDESVELQIDNSAVDTETPGDYPVIYTAQDAAGNETSVQTTVHVKPVTIETVTEETLNIAADKLLAQILNDSMTEYEKAEAIYWWCHDNIAYFDGTPKVDYVDGAYRGIVLRKGDCYTYAMASKCLLTRAGIKNMDIEKIRVGDTMHFWNLIDLGDGWYHFDTARRADGTTFFYKTDAEIMAYSDSHKDSHKYDKSLYPEIQ